MEENRIRNIVWDWNGTLMNDMDLCIECMNTLLEERSLPILTVDRYREVFTFPITEYMQNIGFDFTREPFEVPADSFVVMYNEKYTEVELFDKAKETLEKLKHHGYRQFVLSAQEQGLLNRLLDHYGIIGYFEAVTGITNNYAHSKVEAGRQMVHKLGLDPSETIMIGDTLHDHEVASELGLQCLLMSHGHQSRFRLETAGVPVVDSFPEIGKYISNHNGVPHS